MGNPPKPVKQATTPKAKKVRGVIHINTNRCKGCGFCIEFCPPDVLEFSPEFNPQGYHPPRVARPDECTGCDLCGLYCPDFAIYAEMIRLGQPTVAKPEEPKP